MGERQARAGACWAARMQGGELSAVQCWGKEELWELREGILRGSLERGDPGARPEASKGQGQLFPGRKPPVQRPEVGATLCTDPPPGQLWVGELSFSLDNSCVVIIHTPYNSPISIVRICGFQYPHRVVQASAQSILEHFHHLKEKPHTPHSLLPMALTGLNYLLSPWSRPMRTCHEMETARAVLCHWLLSPSVPFPRSVHVAHLRRISFPSHGSVIFPGSETPAYRVYS